MQPSPHSTSSLSPPAVTIDSSNVAACEVPWTSHFSMVNYSLLLELISETSHLSTYVILIILSSTTHLFAFRAPYSCSSFLLSFLTYLLYWIWWCVDRPTWYELQLTVSRVAFISRPSQRFALVLSDARPAAVRPSNTNNVNSSSIRRFTEEFTVRVQKRCDREYR